jgi:hypothetical protein
LTNHPYSVPGRLGGFSCSLQPQPGRSSPRRHPSFHRKLTTGKSSTRAIRLTPSQPGSPMSTPSPSLPSPMRSGPPSSLPPTTSTFISHQPRPVKRAMQSSTCAMHLRRQSRASRFRFPAHCAGDPSALRESRRSASASRNPRSPPIPITPAMRRRRFLRSINRSQQARQ